MNLFFNKENNLRNIWWVVVFFLFLSVFLFPLILLSDRFSFQVTMKHQISVISMTTILCQWLRRKPIYEITGKLNLTWLQELLLGLCIGAVLIISPVLLLSIGGWIQWKVNSFSFSTFLSVFSMLLLASLAEELLFRGFLFQRLIQAFGNWPAQVIIAILFLLTHVNNPNMTGILKTLACINIFIASIMFGIAYIKTASLAMPLGLHFMANFIQGPIFGFGVSGDKEPSLFLPILDSVPDWLSGGDFGIEASVFGLCFVIFMTIFLFFWRPKSHNYFR